MSITNPTLEDVWQLFREVAAAQKIGEQQLQEPKRVLEKQSQEADRRFQETEHLLKEQSQETERFLREQSQETDRKIKAVSTQIGHLTNRLGEFVEEMVRPAVVRLFRERGFQVSQVLRDLIAL